MFYSFYSKKPKNYEILYFYLFTDLFTMTMKIHVLKLQQPFLNDVCFNRKEFELRKNDRDFKVGDYLILVEYPCENPRYIFKIIKYILYGGVYGLADGFVILGLKDVPNVDYF